MREYAFLAAMSATVVTGAVRAAFGLAERRSKQLGRRLRASPEANEGSARAGPASLLRRTQYGRQKFILLPNRFADRLNAALAASGNRLKMPHLILAGIGAALLAGLSLKAAQLPAVLAVAVSGVAALAGPVALLRLVQGRFQRRFLEGFPDALDLIIRAVRAGLPALDAMDLASREIGAPVGTEFRRMLDDMLIGVDTDLALQRTADRVRVPEFRFFVVCLMLQQRTGGGLADTLSNLSTVIRQRRSVLLRARALVSESKASAAVLALMPFVAGGGLFLINRSLMSSLFFDSRGRFMLALATASLCLGVSSMFLMIRKGLR